MVYHRTGAKRKKRILTRSDEHKSNILKEQWTKSAVALHSKNCPGEINFEEAETVAIIPKAFDRKVRETLEIQKHDCHLTNGGMNPDHGQYVTTKFWFPMLKWLKKNEESTRREGEE